MRFYIYLLKFRFNNEKKRQERTGIFRVDIVNPVYGDSPYTVQVKFTFSSEVKNSSFMEKNVYFTRNI
jgi:hypothetical protein